MNAISLPASLGKVGDAMGSTGMPARIARATAAVAVFVAAVQLAFSPPLNLFVFGIAVGSLYGLLSVGIILIYRTNRIINFAAAAVGAVPAIAAVLLQVLKGWPYWAALPVVVIGSALSGALVDVLVIRRFATSPRLILTVVTIGVSQLLAFLGIWVPIWLGSGGDPQSVVPTPWKTLLQVDYDGRPLFSGDHAFAVLMVAAVGLALAAFFRFTRMGIAVRASAENADRASLLGIPVRRVGTVAWAIAGFLAGLGIFLRAPLVGVPLDGSLGYSVLVYALAAAVVARMERIPTAIVAGMAVGVLEQASVAKTGSASFSTAMMLVLILLALLTQRRSLARAHDAGTSTWQSVKEFRGIPTELRGVKEVRLARGAVALAAAALLLGAPWLVGASRVGKLTLLPIDAIVAVSLVILTGWAGQISLGQYGIVGMGAAVAGGLAANHNIDMFAAIGVGIAVGAGVSVLIGIPALRVPGLYLAVTTLAFAAAVEGWILRPDFPIGERILPKGEGTRIQRPWLWQRIDLADERTFYFMTLVFLGVALLAARSFRRNRSGRVLIAVRDNQRAAPAYAINLARNKLAAFAISGAIASLGGVLLAYQQRAIDYSTYGIGPSVEIFIVTVVGGLTSLPGAVLGAGILGTLKLFGDELFEGASTLATGAGILVILMFLPGGFAEGFYRIRDGYLRWVANRRGILVPSLVADKRVEPDVAEQDIIEQAEAHVEDAPSFDVAGAVPTVRCPLCDLVLTVEDAPEHEHLRPRELVAVGAEAAPAVAELEGGAVEDKAGSARRRRRRAGSDGGQ